MAERIETVSFDVDVSGATKQVDAYIGTLQRLEKELITLQKEGKDTSAVQSQIASTTAQLNKALQAETTTLKGATAQTAAYQKAQTQLDATTKKAVVSTNSLTTATQKSSASFARSLGSAKNLTQAFTRGAGALGNFVGGFGLAGIAINALSDGAAKLINALFAVSLAQESVDNVSNAYAETVAKETAALEVNFAALNNTNLSLSQRKDALTALIAQFPEYFGGLDAEKSTVQELQLAYEATTIAIKQKAIQSALSAEREKIAAKRISAEIELEKGLAAFRKRRLSEGKTEAEVEALVSKLKLAGTTTYYAEYLDILEETTKAEEALNNVELQLTKGFTKADKDKVKAAEEAAKARVKDQKAQEAAAEKAKQRREAEESERRKKREAAKEEQAENERLKGTLAGLQKELANVNKTLTEQTQINDKQRLAELGEEYQRLTKEIEKAQAAIEEATKARKADEVQVIQNAKIGNIETELLRGRIADNQRLSEQLEIQRQRELNLIETRRQAALEATKNETARNVVNAAAAKEREAFEAQSAENILNLRIKLQKQKLDLAAREKQDTTEIAKEVLRLEAELLELTGKEYNVKIGVDTKSGEDAKKKLKRLVNEVADVVEEFSGQVFDFLSSQNQQALATAEAAISKQQELLNGLLANEEQTNVEQVRLEQERLDKLNDLRQKAKEDEARIAQAQIAINLALAVARAAAEGGGVASAITIGIALSAAIFGFLKAKQTAQQAFYEGTMYAERAPHEPRGRDTINARLNEGEAVIPTDTTREYNKSLDAIYYGKIPAKVLNGMVGDYLSGARATREATDNAANTNRREFRILQLSKVEPAPNAPQRTTSDIKLIADLMVSELRKQPQNLLKGDKLVRMVQSKADASGKVRKRLGLK